MLPVYNAEQYLREAVESILHQSYPHFELLLINDGSTDGSETICKSFTDERIRYIKNETNLGLIASLNKGIELAKGDYIARMDADDVSLPKRFEAQVQFFQKHPDAVVVSTDHYGWYGTKKIHIKNHYSSDELKSILLFATCFCHPTVMLKNCFKEKNTWYDKDARHVEDYKLWTELAFHGGFYNVNTPLLLYRSHAQQVSNIHHTVQLKNSEAIRAAYLKALGFNYTSAQYAIHNAIGNNVFFTSLIQLQEAEKLLLFLRTENERLNRFQKEAFDTITLKFWMDSCGHSNLGFKAFRLFHASVLTNTSRVRFKDRLKLLVKCMLRSTR